MRKIRKNDQVIIIAGKDLGRRGVILRILDNAQYALVENVNLVKKHVKPNPQKDQKGGIVVREAPIHLSKVALYNPATKKADRVGFKFLEDGRKVRYFKSNQELVDI